VYPIISSWSVSEVSSGLTFFHLYRQWTRFLRYLKDFAPAVTTSDFIRLLVMALAEMTLALSFNSILLWRELKQGYYTYHGWADIHSNFSRIRLVPTFILTEEVHFWFIFGRWMPTVSSLIVFAIFSFTEDVVKDYRDDFTWLLRVVLPGVSRSEKPKTLPNTLYVYFTPYIEDI
jgi:pheromone a factor receptor